MRFCLCLTDIVMFSGTGMTVVSVLRWSLEFESLSLVTLMSTNASKSFNLSDIV